jgi:hypothetical protein
MSEVETPRRRPRWRVVAALAVLVGGVALIAATLSQGEKEPVAIHVSLPKGVKGLRLDVQREQRAVEHLEWSYLDQSPLSQEASLKLTPGEYVVTLHALGAGHDPGPLELHVVKDEPTKLAVEVR